MTAISLKNLTVQFGSFIPLMDISLQIDEGAFISVVGPNGGGKSTLIKVLLGLIKPDSGKAGIFGKNPDEISSDLIGYVPQIKTLDRSFPALPIELVVSGITGRWSGLMKPAIKRQALEAMEQVGVAHLAKRPLSKLSGGEMQKVYLARSLARKPKLLFLDEPVTGIDSAAEKDISKLIDEYHNSSGLTVVMVTHDWEAAYHHSSKVLLLNRTVVCFDSPKTAFRDDNLRLAFGHIGHKHEMNFGVKHHD